jgi:hypothetical protein
MSPMRIRPVGGATGCLVMIALSVGLSILLTVLLNLGR